MASLLPEIFVPAFEMTVDDQPLELDIARRITEISVTQHISPPNQFSFRFYDPLLPTITTAEGPFTEGTQVAISMGYVDDLQPVITGEITSLTADFSDHAPPTVQVEGYDLLTRLTRGTTYRWFEEPDSAIVKTIAGEMELTPDVDATPARIGRRAQNGVTNLKMLEDLAKANNFFFWVDGQTLFFKKQRPAPGTVQLEYGKTLISFSARLNLVGQVEAVRVRGWDEVQKQEISGRAERPPSDLSLLSPSGQQQIALGAGGQSELLVQETNIASEQEAKTMAEGLMAEQRNTLLTGQGVSVGHPDIHVGTELELIGIGRFDGTYTVGQVTHTINDSGYRTSFQVRRKW